MSSASETKARRRRLGVILKKYRNAAGLTQKELSKQLGLDYYTFVSQIEGGSARIPPEMFLPWAKALGLDPADFAKVILQYYEPEFFALLFGDPNNYLTEIREAVSAHAATA